MTNIASESTKANTQEPEDNGNFGRIRLLGDPIH